jgi:transposase-like protein
MSKRSRRNHSSQFKAKVALAAARGDKTLVEVAEQFAVHPNQVTSWKRQLQENAQLVFERESRPRHSDSDVKELHAIIGKQKVELDFFESAFFRAGLLNARK